MSVDFIKAFKLPIKYKYLIAIATGFVLFLPSEISLKIIGLTIEGTYRILIGIAFLLSSSSAIIESILIISSNLINNTFNNGSLINRKQFKKLLHNLSEEEIRYISTFIDHDTKYLDMPINDGIVIELSNKKVIGRQGTVSKGGVNFPFKISDDVYRFLKEHLVVMEDGKITRIQKL